ncbi:hypothetical protein ZIOFF_051350 [Zingiber officinale]|uniref:C2H2-type domain-containing protein n=1 Tax=Zingiber officinale TaxID=94328 RepID=A0A8J5KUI8_ZINOF|nr:hypothetical protein ZIOFF_051350 [Zingiber officinale]
MESGSYSSCTISSPEEGINLPEATTWPPRSYSCAFCRRGFKSAQALGGHMNVHRRDRALLRRQRPESCPSAATASPPYSVVIPTQPQPELVAPGGVFLLYPIALASPPSYFSGAGRRSSESTLCSDGVGKDGGEELDLELRLGCARVYVRLSVTVREKLAGWRRRAPTFARLWVLGDGGGEATDRDPQGHERPRQGRAQTGWQELGGGLILRYL